MHRWNNWTQEQQAEMADMWQNSPINLSYSAHGGGVAIATE